MKSRYTKSKIIFRQEPEDVNPYKGDIVRLYAIVDGKEVGRLDFWFDFRANKKAVTTESMTVDTNMQGQGIGTALFKEFKRRMNRNFPWIKYMFTVPTSKGSYRLNKSVFGKPLYLTNGIRLLDENAVEKMCERGSLDERGEISWSGAAYDAVFWIGRGKCPKNHPWAEMYREEGLEL